MTTLEEIKAKLDQQGQGYEQVNVKENGLIPTCTLLSIEPYRESPQGSLRVVMTFLANGEFDGVTLSRKS